MKMTGGKRLFRVKNDTFHWSSQPLFPFVQVHERNGLRWFRRSIIILACCTTARPVKLPLLLRNGNDGVYFVQNLKIIDDAPGVVVYSCIAEHMNGGASSSTQGLR